MTSVTRRYTALKKRRGDIRKLLPYSAVAGIKGAEEWAIQARNLFTSVKHRSECVNVFHWCLQKTGSVWIQTLLSDAVVYKYSGMQVSRYSGQARQNQAEPITHIRKPFPRNHIVSAMKGAPENYFNDVPKHDGLNRAFYVSRDPRDMLVSWYFSTKDNHILQKGSQMYERRELLRSLDTEAGLRYSIDVFVEKGKFEIGAKWFEESIQKDTIKYVHYEDLVGKDAVGAFHDLFNFLDFQIPEDELSKLVNDYSFKSLTGRDAGKENVSSHMRSGSAGGWRKYFNSELTDYFVERCGSLEKQGYTW